MASKTDIINSKLQQIKRLTTNIVVKQEKRAKEYETEEIYSKYQTYRFAVEELDTLLNYNGSDFDYYDIRVTFPKLPVQTVNDLMNDVVKFDDLLNAGVISNEEYSYFLNLSRMKRIDEYEEENNYYRMLIGLPPIETKPEDFIYVFDGTKPIHEITQLEYYKLVRSGEMQVIVGENPDKPYLKFIGKNISLFEAREAEEFEVLWVANNTESQLYREVFNRERKVFNKTYHHEYLCYSTDFHEAYELTALKMRAAIYYIIETSSPSLSKTTFTKEESEDLFKEYGLSFPKNMPSAYRDAISFVLAYMVIWKGTNYALEYITNTIFSGLKLYKYFIRKRHKQGIPIPVPIGTPPEQVYDVDFVLRPYNATNILDSDDPTREEMVLTYDDVVQLDPRWRDTDELKKAVFSEEFSYVESKYISLDNTIDLSELSTAISVMSRIIIENKALFSKYSFVYSVTGLEHTYYNLWIYFLALYFGMIERIRTTAPDTLTKITKALGFRVPKNIDTIKIYWVWYLRMNEDLHHVLDDFPNALNDNDEFFDMLIHIDASIGMARVLDQVMAKARTFQEYKLILEIYKLVRVVNTCPTSYFEDSPTVDGKTYADYLEVNDELLFLEFEEAMTNEDVNILILEVDNIVQTLIQITSSFQTDDESYRFENIVNGLNQANMIVGGISKYLIYIIKLFKAYSVDFIADTSLLSISDRYNYQKNIEQPYFNVNITTHDRWNMSQYDYLEKPYHDKTDVSDNNLIKDSVFVVTPYGDILISD